MINPYLHEGIFILSEECPFACDYCYNQWCKTSNNLMSLNLIKKGIDFLVDNYIKYPSQKPISIFFLGGEPLLHFNELIIPTIEYLQKYSNFPIQKTITTNGYFLNLDKVQICAELGIKVNISFDGNKIVQDAHRKTKLGQGTFDKVFENTQYAIGYDILQCINSVYCDDTINKLSDTYFFFKSIGVPLWFPHPLINFQWTELQKQIFAIELEKICEDYCAVENPDMKIGPLAIESQKQHNTLLFYSDGEISYNFPNYFVAPKEYPNIQSLGNILKNPILDNNQIQIFQNTLNDRLNDKWFGNMPIEICKTCPIESDCITPQKTNNKILKEICYIQDPMECYQRRLFKIYEEKYSTKIRRN